MKTSMPAVSPRRQAESACPNANRAPGAVDRWELLKLVIELRKPLSLNDRDIAVLQAHLTVLPKGDLHPEGINVSFMKVTAVRERSCGMEPKRFHRGEVRLEAAELIRRNLSANGRRYPERDGRDTIVDAYGIDLSPLLRRHGELLKMRDRLIEEERRLARRKNAVSARLQAILRRIRSAGEDIPSHLAELRDRLRNTLRRMTTAESDLDRLENEISDLEAGMTEAPRPGPSPGDLAVAPVEMEVRDGQNVRRMESDPESLEESLTDVAPETTVAHAWAKAATLSSYYPHPPIRQHQVATVLYEFSSFIGLGRDRVTDAISHLGLPGVITAFDYIAEKLDHIRQPNAYLASMLKRYARGEPIASGRLIPRLSSSLRRAPCPA